MPAFFPFILLALLLQSLAHYHGTTDNDTTILALEDIFDSPPDLDKRVWTLFTKKKKHEMITVPLTMAEEDGSDYPQWFLRPFLRPTPNFKFQIDTYGVCSSVPFNMKFFNARRRYRSFHICPGRSYSGVRPFTGSASRSRITIASRVTWEGRLFEFFGVSSPPDRGTLGLSLSDSTVPEDMHTLPNLLKMFQSRAFALSLSEHKLHIGGYNKSLVIQYCKVVKNRDRQPWQIGHVRIFVDDTEIVPENTENTHTIPTVTTAFDSSTPYVYGPPTEVQKILTALDHAHNMGRVHPVVYFQWEGQTKWPLMSDLEKRYSLFKQGPATGMEGWVLGTEFTYAYYMAHIIDDANEPWMGIGWAPGVRPPAPENRLPQHVLPLVDENGPPPPYSEHRPAGARQL